MKETQVFTVNSLLKEQLLDYALLKGDKLVFDRMMSPEWEFYLENFYITEKKCDFLLQDSNEKIGPFLETEFFETYDESMPDLEDYIEQTTLTDVFSEKKKTLYQLMVMTRSINKEVNDFINRIYEDDELTHLLTITTEKKYRNGVFYMDEEDESIKIKDLRREIKSLSLNAALEYYRTSQETFFLEIKIIKAKEEDPA